MVNEIIINKIDELILDYANRIALEELRNKESKNAQEELLFEEAFGEGSGYKLGESLDDMEKGLQESFKDVEMGE